MIKSINRYHVSRIDMLSNTLTLSGWTLSLNAPQTLVIVIALMSVIVWLGVVTHIMRRHRKRLIWAVLLSVANLVSIGLLFILLFVRLSHSPPPQATQPLIVVTENAPESPTEALDTRGLTRNEIADRLKSHRRWHILGDGFSRAAWQDFAQLGVLGKVSEVEHTPGIQTVGLAYPEWEKTVTLGESVSLHVRVVGEQLAHSDTIFNVSLTGPDNQRLQQHSARAGESITFHFVPKAEGQWLYSLELSSRANSVIAKEAVPVVVTAGDVINAVIIQSSASFETRHLHNWLTEQGSNVIVYTTVSRDKVTTQRFNLSDNNVLPDTPALSSEQLRWADVVITDTRSLSSWTTAQIDRLADEISTGLGFFVIVDETSADTSVLHGIWTPGSLRLEDVAETSALPAWPGALIEEPVVTTPARLQSVNGSHLVVDQQRRAVVATTPVGRGQVGMSVLPSSYVWRLQGKPALHSRYWQRIISNLARPKSTPRLLHQHGMLSARTPFHHRSLDVAPLCLDTEKQPTDAVLTHADSAAAQIKQQPLRFQPVPFVSNNRYCSAWVRQAAGWHAVQFQSGEHKYQLPFYVMNDDAFYAYQQIQTRQATSDWRNRLNSAQNDDTAEGIAQDTFPPLWLFYLWFTVTVLLWLEQKWHNVVEK
ncbi:hypothetical protein [Alteromonas oceanisediminis]|uniref:hypothetical protein n=1 Tax=Alteromonas oceanisediminis TaxID=2836180 RepID=UPI001BDA1C53|nr:hypothetical protein [Alteromonas oceanisediminis]MBT0586631.1 hypothetical protein [Alteromonas oceanisediminis]